MKVSELIAKLQEMPQDQQIIDLDSMKLNEGKISLVQQVKAKDGEKKAAIYFQVD